MGREFAVAVEPEVTTNDMSLMVKMALAGSGLTIGMSETFAPWLHSGKLKEVLGSFCPPLPGFFLFYPGRRHMPLKLRALVDHVADWRSMRKGSIRY